MMKIKSPLLALFVLAAFSVPLMAHISVNPRTSEAGIHHKLFYIRAPVEKAIPVIELGFEVSEEWRDNGGDVNSFQHVPGWDLNVDFDDEGKVTKVFWTGGEAPRETFMMFYMSMNVPETPGEYSFKAWQKWKDGSELWFNEPRGEGVEAPFPTVTVEEADLEGSVTEATAEEEHFLSSGVFHLGSGAMALLALAISLVSARNGKKGAE
jgi:uncharacterized protein YcnI